MSFSSQVYVSSALARFSTVYSIHNSWDKKINRTIRDNCLYYQHDWCKPPSLSSNFLAPLGTFYHLAHNISPSRFTQSQHFPTMHCILLARKFLATNNWKMTIHLSYIIIFFLNCSVSTITTYITCTRSPYHLKYNDYEETGITILW